MVGIRSITYNIRSKFDEHDLKKIEHCSRLWDASYSEIHTQRLNFTPYTRSFEVNEFQTVINMCERTSVRWFNVPVDVAESSEPEQLLFSLKTLLAECGRAFGNIIGVKDNHIDPQIIKYYAQFIDEISRLDISGKDNFRVGFSVNIGYNTPFFPFTQSAGDNSFSIALEIAKDMNDVCKNSRVRDLNELRELLIQRLYPQIEEINSIAESISEETGLSFAGFDFSLAPSIDPCGSVITILNSIGVYNFGKSGTMFATSYITDILKYFAKEFKSIGFSGVMYSLLEDLELCRINNERGISIEQLTMVSTMCGCGLDMVPLYSDISLNEIMTLCYDVAAISCKLGKPLGVRLLPIQKCKRGMISYTSINSDADFIANTKIVQPDVNILSISNNSFEYMALPTIK